MVRVYEDISAAGVIPRYKGKAGHPVLFGPEMIQALLTLEEGKTARDVVEKFESRIHYLDTEEEAVVRDLDTWEEYARFARSTKEEG